EFQLTTTALLNGPGCVQIRVVRSFYRVVVDLYTFSDIHTVHAVGVIALTQDTFLNEQRKRTGHVRHVQGQLVARLARTDVARLFNTRVGQRVAVGIEPVFLQVAVERTRADALAVASKTTEEVDVSAITDLKVSTR